MSYDKAVQVLARSHLSDKEKQSLKILRSEAVNQSCPKTEKILFLQRNIGNLAANSLIKSGYLQMGFRVKEGAYLQRNAIQRVFIQRIPADETPKYSIIDYKKAKLENINSWFEQYKFYDLFKEKKVSPDKTPIAYANHVYELQTKLEDVYQGWTAPGAGILESVINADSLLVKLMLIAEKYHADNTAHYGLDTKMLERLYKYKTGFEEKPPPLVSEYFSGVRQLELVNRNRYFYILFGDRGEYVKRLQIALLILNYDIPGDIKLNKETKEKEASGVFGRGTRQAVINFQKDSGFEGKDIDGIVGQMTLRLLDKRIGAPALKRTGVSSGNAYLFYVPVTESDLYLDKEVFKRDLLKRTLKTAFPITEEQIDVLVRSGWHWINYKDLEKADVDVGYKKVTIDKSSYQSVISKIDRQEDGKAGEPVEEKLEKQTIDLLKTGKLYELNKKISDLESRISSEKVGNPEMMGADIDWESIRKNEDILESLKKERQQELNRLGISLDDYEKMKTDFIKTFERFAVIIALQMLSENEIQANIEAQHYAKIEEVAAIKSILSDLSGKYKESEKLWWEAVSLEDTRGKDASYYKDSLDYGIKNTSYGGEIAIDTSDPTRYYSETNVANMYKEQEKNPGPYFTPWKEKEKNVVTTLQEAVKKFPILAYPKLELRRNAGKDAAMSDGDLQKMLLTIVKGTEDEKGIQQNIESTRKELAENPKKIWELPVVVLRAQYALGIVSGVPTELIKTKQEDVAKKSFWESIGMAILGIGLGLLALASGPVGWLALGASIGVGAYEAYRTYGEITFKKETAGTAIDPASALGTEDPSYFWFWVSLVTVGLDVFQAAKLVKSVAKGVELAEGVTKGLEEAKAAAQMKLLEAGGESTAKGKAILKEIEEIEDALTKVKSTEFAENIKLLEPLKSNPMAVIVMNEALKDKKIVQAVTSLARLVDKEVFEDALKFYAGVGKKSLDELPELLRLIKKKGLDTNKLLMEELLSDPRTQRVLLDTQDPELIAAKFSEWEKAIKTGESKSFVNYLEAENLTARITTDTKLVDMFGEAFSALPNMVKNRQILRTVEPRLLDAFNVGTLSPEIKKAMEVMLNSDMLAQSTRLSSAQERMLREIRMLGSVIETQSDFSKVLNLLDNPASRRALWEGASQLAGKDKYIEIILKANGGRLPAPDVIDDLIRIGPMTDEGTVKSLLSGAGEEVRKLLAANPEAVAVLKRCASPCLPPFVSPEQIVRVEKIMKGRSKDDLLRIREFLYANRSSDAEFSSALEKLEKDLSETLKNVDLPRLRKPSGLNVPDDTLRAIIDLNLPVSVLNQIMKKAAGAENGSKIVYDLMRVLQFEKNVSLKNFDTIIRALSEGKGAEYSAARILLDESGRFANASTVGARNFKYTGLEKADALLSHFSLTELHSLMNAPRGKGFVNSLYDVVDKMPGLDSNKIIDLINKAGGGKAPGDLGRLQEILSTIKAPSVTYDEATKAIQASDVFAAEVAKAMRDPATGYDAMVKLIWGEEVTVDKGIIKVKEALGESGGEAIRKVFELGKGESLSEILSAGGTIHKDKWKVFRKVIEDSNIETSIKNNIIGEMWTRVNEQAYRGMGYKTFREIEITTGRETAIADIILEKGQEIIVVECKSGGAKLSDKQEIIYQLLQEGKFKSVMIRGDETLASKFADVKTRIRFILANELEIIK